MKHIIIAACLAVALSGCKQETIVKEIEVEQNKNEYNVQAVLWQQHAAENDALYYQGYNTAKLQLDAALENILSYKKTLAIITDIDETVLDNSPYNAKLIKDDLSYTKESWNEWCQLAQAKPLPGAVSFLNYAASKGVVIFYITNRRTEVKEVTLKNLQKYNFPFADASHIQLKEDMSNKEPRRQKILDDYEVILYMGDNLADFADVFEGNDRNQKAAELAANFGTKFIVFPNPMYGDWESKGIFEGNMGGTPMVIDSVRKSKLEGY